MFYKLRGKPEWWIGDDGFDAGRSSDLTEEITNEMQTKTVIMDVRRNHGVAVVAQHRGDRAVSGRAFPYPTRDRLSAKQSFDRYRWGRI